MEDLDITVKSVEVNTKEGLVVFEISDNCSKKNDILIGDYIKLHDNLILKVISIKLIKDLNYLYNRVECKISKPKIVYNASLDLLKTIIFIRKANKIYDSNEIKRIESYSCNL